jgi:hypothetical protein
MTTAHIPAQQADRLSHADLETLKVNTIAAHPGLWLHHYGRAIEEEVLRRHRIAFTPVTAIGA